MKWMAGSLLAVPFLVWSSTLAIAAQEPPSLAPLVAAEKLPTLTRRIPDQPLVLQTDPQAAYGGKLRMLIGTPKDLKLASIYGYTRLVRYDRNYEIVPDIAEDLSPGLFHFPFDHRHADID